MTGHDDSPPALRLEDHGGLRGKLEELFGIDARSLALFRVGLASTLLVDLWSRAKALREHYTGEGMFPREIALTLRPDSRLFHVFLWSDRFEVQAALFAIFAALVLIFLVGWRTRAVNVLLFVFLVSIVRRNPYACHTGDVWLKALVFWGMFLPLGAAASIDRLRSRSPPRNSKPILTLATAAVLLQILVFYVSTGYLKQRYDVWRRGDAVMIFTNVIEYARPFGAWLGQFPAACRALTYLTLFIEGLAPFLFFVPYRTARLRCLLVVVFTGFHLGIQALVHIGLFQVTSIVALSLFLPAWFWERVVPRPLVALGTALRARLSLRIGPRASAVEPGWLRGAGRAGGWTVQALAALSLALILVTNFNTARSNPYAKKDDAPIPIPRALDDFVRPLGLIQNWNMFTDIEPMFFGWFLGIAQLEDGSIVDVLERREFDGIRAPEHFASYFANHNARRFWRNAAIPGNEFLLRGLAGVLCRRWEDEGRGRIVHFALFHVGKVPARGGDVDTVKRLCVFSPPRPQLALAPDQARMEELRAQWRAFLAGLPKTVPSARASQG